MFPGHNGHRTLHDSRLTFPCSRHASPPSQPIKTPTALLHHDSCALSRVGVASADSPTCQRQFASSAQARHAHTYMNLGVCPDQHDVTSDLRGPQGWTQDACWMARHAAGSPSCLVSVYINQRRCIASPCCKHLRCTVHTSAHSRHSM